MCNIRQVCGNDDATVCYECIRPKPEELARELARELGGPVDDWLPVAASISKWLG